MSSSSSIISSVAVASPPAGFSRKSSLEIRLFDHYAAKVYSSGSPIRGEVVITPLRDAAFDSLQIFFVGLTKTKLEAVQIPQQSCHAFLKLSMPIPESAYPVPRVFEVGRSYVIPFNFVVPAMLTLGVCNHQNRGEHVSDYHTRLPPSTGSWSKDDLSPATAVVEYSVKVRALRDSGAGPNQETRVFEAERRINVLPTGPEDPPINITSSDRNYKMTKTKNIRKNILSSKMGQITATAAQPPAVHLKSDGIRASEATTTVHLTFMPSSPTTPPPEVHSLSAKLATTTYYSATPMSRLPNLGLRADFPIEQQLAYRTSVSLPNASVSNMSWKQQNICIERRDSGYSTDHPEADASDLTKAPLSHTATVTAPIKLPFMRKLFLPTFHSCLISRVYTLDLFLSIGPGNTTVHLALPLQVVVDPSESSGRESGLPSFDAAMAQAEHEELDEFMRPRVIRMPASELQGNSILPGYT